MNNKENHQLNAVEDVAGPVPEISSNAIRS